jgi:regulator of sigma E protease
MDTFIKIAQFLLSLSLLIVLHEWGHYYFARLFKTRVNKFYLFFDFLFPIPTLLNFSLFKKKVGDTEFGIGWFPLGGYVQIDGMQDETQDAEKLKLPPQPWEFRSKKPWQRLFIMMGGIIVNVLVAFVIYAMVLFVWGEKKIINSSLKDGIAVGDSLMYKMGFKDGDRVVAINGDSIKYFDDVAYKILIEGGNVEVNRAGQKVVLPMDKDLLGQLSTKKIDKKGLIGLRGPTIIDSADESYTKLSNAYKAGIRPNDKVVKIDSVNVSFRNEITNYVNAQKDSATIAVTVLRGDTNLVYQVQLNKDHQLGLSFITDFDKLESMNVLKIYKKNYGFFESFPAGVAKTFTTLGKYIDQFKLLFKPSTGAYKGMGGFASMTKAFGTSWDWESFWGITAFFSIALAFMNFLPIPMLDGGYILFTLVEMITGKKMPDRIMEKINMIGFFIIIGLMLFTNGNDVFRKFKGWF